ncbi:S6e family ribosomal protein [Nanoarchaeota archaeon]
MVFKLDIGYKGKTFHVEAEAEALIGKKLGETVKGEDLKPELAGTEFEITGASDGSGFPASDDLEGTGLNKELLTEGFAMKHVHKQKKTSNPKPKKGLRLRRTLRGSTISADIVQINLKLTKEGDKPLPAMLGIEEKKKEEVKEKSAEEIQKEMEEMKANMAKAESKPEEKPAEKPAEEKPAEKPEEPKA